MLLFSIDNSEAEDGNEQLSRQQKWAEDVSVQKPRFY